MAVTWQKWALANSCVRLNSSFSFIVPVVLNYIEFISSFTNHHEWNEWYFLFGFPCLDDLFDGSIMKKVMIDQITYHSISSENNWLLTLLY